MTLNGYNRGVRKYLAIVKLNLSGAIVDRAHAFSWTIVDALRPLIMMLVWLSAYGGKNLLGSFDKNEIVFYFVGVAFLERIAHPYFGWEIVKEIREGSFRNRLLKPVHFWWWLFFAQIPWQVSSFLAFFPVLLLFQTIAGVENVLPRFLGTDGAAIFITFLTFLPAIAIAYLLNFAVETLFGLVGIYLLNIGGVFTLVMLIRSIFSGELAPFELLPEWVKIVGDFLPFRYMVYFPLQILLQKLGQPEIVIGLSIGGLWAFALNLSVNWFFKKSTRSYEAYGG